MPWKKTFIVTLYALFVTFLLTFKAIKHDDNFQERLGFRAAWITATQTSLPFLLAARFNPIGLVLGVSYERVNWFHRWASRVFIASATVHGAFFVTEWIAADFFWTELKTVKMVTPGLIAWLVLVWTLISSWMPIRSWKYEFFVFQHIASTVLLLVLLLLHVPNHHHFSIWCAVVAFAYDVVTRTLHAAWRNIRIHSPSGALGRLPRCAYRGSVEAIDSGLTVLTIKDVTFQWSPGQHVLIWTPTLRNQSPHPFTIANIPDPLLSTQQVQLTIKTKSGFTKELNEWAQHPGHDSSLRFIIAGPYGSSPNWRQFDSLVLIASATGGSFTTPILEDLITSRPSSCLRKINALYIARRKAHVQPYLKRISSALSRCKELGISVRIHVAITQALTSLDTPSANESSDRLIHGQNDQSAPANGDVELSRMSLDSIVSSQSGGSDQLLKEEMDLGISDDVEYDTTFIYESAGRPDVTTYIKTALGDVPGEVAVAVCAGNAIEQQTQKAVASVRSLQKEAQRVFLHIERAGA